LQEVVGPRVESGLKGRHSRRGAKRVSTRVAGKTNDHTKIERRREEKIDREKQKATRGKWIFEKE
jgi:hypothetical protein